MVEIKDVYETLDSKTLDEDIIQNYSSNLQGILLGLVKGKESLCIWYLLLLFINNILFLKVKHLHLLLT